MTSTLFIRTLFASSLVSLVGCGKDAPKQGQDTPPKAAEDSTPSEAPTNDQTPAPSAASVRGKLEPYRSLVKEAARAELSAKGLFVDFGTADQHKFIRGAWRTGWGEIKSKGGVSFTHVTGGTARVEGSALGKTEELVLRVRSAVPGQEVAAWVNGVAAGRGAVGADWTTVRIPVKNAQEAGRRTVLIRFKKKGAVRGDVDWLWMAETKGAEPPAAVPRVIPVNLGRPKRALVAPTERTYSFYLDVPKDASLVFDYGSDKGAKFSVMAQEDTKDEKTLFGPKTSAKWQEGVVDLKAWAGKTVRLSFRTEGDGGLAGWGEPEIMTALGDAPKPSNKKAKNAIVILIDTVRADSFAHINPKNEVVTPTYDALAKESTVFVNAYNNENWTKPSVATTLTGLYPSTHTTKKDGSKMPQEVEMISQRLKKEGFSTAGFVANGYVSNKFGFEKGWDAFKNYIRIGKPSEAERVYADSLAWLKENKDKRYFLYIQTIDPHVVYKVEREFTKHYYGGEYKGILGNTVTAEEQIGISNNKLGWKADDLDWLKALYWGEVTYHDHHMGKFLEEIKKMGELEDTVLLVTNDHGEELLEHGRIGHGHSLYEELLRAPLLAHFPGLFPKGKQVKEVVENVDVAPTLMDILGLKPLKGAEGQSLLGLLNGRPAQRPYYAISEFLDSSRSVRVGRWKFIRTAGNRSHLFDVEEDPGERLDYHKDGANGRPIARRMAEIHLGEGLAVPDKSQRQSDQATRQTFSAGCADIDPATRKQLAALGYFGDDSNPCDDKAKAN